MLTKTASEIKPGNILAVKTYKNPSVLYVVLSVENYSDITVTMKLLSQDLKTYVWYKGFQETVKVLC